MAYAVIRIRGTIRTKPKIRETLRHLNLTRINHCVIVPNTPHYTGMLQKAKDYITWGEITPEKLARLILLKGKTKEGNKVTDKFIKEKEIPELKSIIAFAKTVVTDKGRFKDMHIRPVLRLAPPVGGYKSIKRPYRDKGDLGYRGNKINDLIERMIAIEAKHAAPKGKARTGTGADRKGKPVPKETAKPVPKEAAKPVPKEAAKPVPKKIATPVPKPKVAKKPKAAKKEEGK